MGPIKLYITPHLHSRRGVHGRKQVNKALHTCTSSYAYAAMFGSSKASNVNHAICIASYVQTVKLHFPGHLLAVFCQPKPLAYILL